MPDDITPIPPRDPPRDPELVSALRGHFGDASRDEQVDWPAFHERLVARAGERLAARRARPWWGYAAEWARPAIPVGLAAGLLLALGLSLAGTPSETRSVAATAEPVAMEDLIATTAAEALPGDLIPANDYAALVGATLEPTR